MEGRAAEPILEPPEAVHSRPSNAEDESDEEREATELHNVAEQRPARHVTTSPAGPQWQDDIKKLWRHHIRLSVPHIDCRDHLGRTSLMDEERTVPIVNNKAADDSRANERTYLGYLRTSLALSMIGVIISQLYRLQHSPSPDLVYGYYVLSKPIASIFHASALGVILVGAVRFFRQQSAMSISKVHTGGWEVLVVCGWVCLLLLAVLALHIGADVYDAS